VTTGLARWLMAGTGTVQLFANAMTLLGLVVVAALRFGRG
jgi:hypothetical protein